MIFISHSHNDKVYVDAIAQQLADTFGRENIFYDSWSIQPGDSIIGKMSDGLAACTHFFFFVTESSKVSYAAGLEWQNALMKAGSGALKFVAVRAENCAMPAVLTVQSYIDLYGQGIDVAVSQMRDVVRGISNYSPKAQVQNLKATVEMDGKQQVVTIEAMHFVEPTSRFVFVAGYGSSGVKVVCNDPVFRSGLISLGSGMVKVDAPMIAVDRSLTPGRPLVARLIPDGMFYLERVLHWKTDLQEDLPNIPIKRIGTGEFSFAGGTPLSLPANFGAAWKRGNR